MIRKILSIAFIPFFMLLSCQQKASDTSESSVYDESLAKSLDADNYGMKKYVMAFLKRGPNRTENKEEANKLQKLHLENINRMAEAGQLILAGPFLDNSEIRGIYIFNVETIEEAKALTESDPLIQSGGLIMELHTWYGSAALQEVNKIHEIIAKENP